VSIDKDKLMNNQITVSIDSELIRDFVDGVEEAYEQLEQHVAAAIENPDELSHVDEIFRELHTIKGNAKICHVEDIADLVHHIETIVFDIREGHIVMSLNLGELILITLDKIRDAANQLYSIGKTPKKIIYEYSQYFETLCSKTSDEIETHSEKIIAKITGALLEFGSPASVQIVSTRENKTNEEIPPAEKHIKNDLQFFYDLILRLEANIQFWDSRSLSMWEIAKAMNILSGLKVDHSQLEAAIYMHDIAYSFLPLDVLHSTKKFSEEEQDKMREHPTLSSELLMRMPHWVDAAVMCYQHHERPDGNGYPHNLLNSEICEGAKILAIVDAFESMTHPRPDREFKRSILRAVKEINTYSSTQFCDYWVGIFNQVVRDRFITYN